MSLTRATHGGASTEMMFLSGVWARVRVWAEEDLDFRFKPAGAFPRDGGGVEQRSSGPGLVRFTNA